MALAQLIYTSRRTPRLTMPVLDDVVAQSLENNAHCNITGVLLCCGKNLMQLLEGELMEITSLYERIRHDELHVEVKCLLMKNVTKRLFPEWGMGLADLDSKAILNPERLAALVDSVRANHDTAHHSVEARLLLNDFRKQLGRAA